MRRSTRYVGSQIFYLLNSIYRLFGNICRCQARFYFWRQYGLAGRYADTRLGKRRPGEKVSVSFMGKSVKTTAGKDGKWHVQLPKSAYVREGQTLSIQGKNKVEIKDVLVGELWLLSGQSNMEWAYEATTGAKEVLQKLNNPQIRYFNMEKRTEEEPLGMHGIDPKIVWRKCDGQSARRLASCLEIECTKI